MFKPSPKFSQPRKTKSSPESEKKNYPPRKINSGTEKEISVYGQKAVQALIENNPNAVVRFFYSKKIARRVEKNFEKFLASMAAEKKVFRSVEDDELEKISAGKHHQGVVAVIKKPVWHNVHENDIWRWQEHGVALVVLQEVSNPYNLGAILRSAAFFGFNQIIMHQSPKQAYPSPAVWKNASGGMEHVTLYQEKNLPRLLSRLKESHYIAAADAHGERLLAQVIKEESRPFVLVLGNEEDGISSAVKAECHASVSIYGCGKMDSLNVSNAAAIFFQQIFQHTHQRIILKKKSK